MRGMTEWKVQKMGAQDTATRQDKTQQTLVLTGSCPRRLSTSALLSSLASPPKAHPRHMQVAVHSVNHCAVWTRPSYVCAPRKQKWVYEKCRNSS